MSRKKKTFFQNHLNANPQRHKEENLSRRIFFSGNGCFKENAYLASLG